MAMIAWWLPVYLLFSFVINSETLEFDHYFSHGTSFFSPQEDDAFGAFSGFAFNPSERVQLRPNFQVPFASESGNIPIYTDGVATPPQVTLSHLEKDYKTQLHRLANTRSAQIHSQSHIRSRQRIPKFRSEPFPSASNVDERQPSSTQAKTTEGPRFTSSKSQPIELQTGFVPIIKGSSQESRNKNIASTVIKDIEPPILTASPGSLTARPTLLKVSASVLSSAKVPASGLRQNSSATASNEVKTRPRQASYSRLLNLKNDTKTIGFSTSSSESVVSRVVSRPESILDLQQKELFRLNPSVVSEESKIIAKKTLEVNCDGSEDLGWCELGDKYPRKYVNQVISSCQNVIDRMHVEVPHSFEKLSDISDFKAQFDNSTSHRSAKERGSHDAWSWAAYFHQGSLCDAETGFLRPETAKDSYGTWNIIVQTETIKQRVPIEMCRKTNGSCKKMLSCGLKSQCLQKYNYHLLLSLNPTQKHDCPFMKLYRFPSACVCHVE